MIEVELATREEGVPYVSASFLNYLTMRTISMEFCDQHSDLDVSFERPRSAYVRLKTEDLDAFVSK
jgi:hypothetical protein